MNKRKRIRQLEAQTAMQRALIESLRKSVADRDATIAAVRKALGYGVVVYGGGGGGGGGAVRIES